MLPMPLKISFSTLACPNWNWHDVLRHGPAYGYDGVEIRQLGGDTNLLGVEDLLEECWDQRRRELEYANFRVCGLASSIKFDAAAHQEVDEQIAVGKGYLRLGQALGAQFIRVFGDTLPPVGESARRERILQQIVDGLKRLGDEAAAFGIQILLETHGDFTSSPIAAEVMSRVDHPMVGLVWDTHHAWRFDDEPLAETWARIRPWVRHTHWKDSVTIGEVELTERQKHAAVAATLLMSGHKHADYVLFRGGEFPAAECLQLLLSGGYSGWHSLEWEKMWHPELLGPEIALPLFPGKLRELLQSVNITNRPVAG